MDDPFKSYFNNRFYDGDIIKYIGNCDHTRRYIGGGLLKVEGDCLGWVTFKGKMCSYNPNDFELIAKNVCHKPYIKPKKYNWFQRKFSIFR